MGTKARLSRLFLGVVDQHQHIADQVAHRAARRVGIVRRDRIANRGMVGDAGGAALDPVRSEEHTSELQSLMRISYAVFCLKKKKNTKIAFIRDLLQHYSDSTITRTSTTQNTLYQ